METINNIASSASKLIYGDKAEQSGQEPVSGQAGRGTATEPYDSGNLHENPEMSGQSAQETNEYNPTSQGSHTTHAGNVLDPRTSDSTQNTTSGTGGTSTAGSAPTGDVGGGGLVDRTKGDVGSSTGGPGLSSESRGSGTSGGPTTSGSTGGAAQGVNATGAIRPEHTTEGTGVTGIHSNDPKGSDVRPTEKDENRPNTNVGGFGTAEPSVGADPKSAQQPVHKQQGADKPTDEPTGAQTDAVREKKDEGEGALAKRDPNDHSGEPLQMHDESAKQEKRESAAGQEGGGVHGKEEGTGEQYVKTSGLKADGGDFDAAKPGAGREADRLMEQKGVQRSGPEDNKDEGSPAPSGEEKSGSSKPSMGTKIKEKLHIGKH